MKYKKEEYQKEVLSKKESIPNDFDIDSEWENIKNLFDNQLRSIQEEYSSFKFEGAGGSGIVLSAIFRNTKNRHAIKIPRKHIIEKYGDPKKEQPDVDPEIDALSKVSHQFIIRLYYAMEIPKTGTYCTITEYVNDAIPLDKYAKKICAEELLRHNDLAKSAKFKELAKIIYKVTDALVYMHNVAHLLHFDIKPDNILVSNDGIPFITDLGFARDITKYKSPDDLVEVGFTWKYAHNLLTNPEKGARISRNPAKSKNRIEARFLLPKIDLYAFGRTIQEVLKTIENIFGENCYSDYLFNYLHLVGCLCLDGENAPNGHLSPTRSFVSDQALGISTSFYKEHKFINFEEVLNSLKRLLGLYRLEDEIPELDSWASSTINVSDIGITTLTERVKSILKHPSLSRLSNEYQLGMLDKVFPTATHSRLQHSIGVYHAVTKYITALFYDPENPLFKVVFNERLCKFCLLTSLIHDIGHSTLGHELEEVDKIIFSHEKITEIILNDNLSKDEMGRTIKQIVEGNAYDEWDLDLSDLIDFFNKRFKKPLEGVFFDITNGQLDADKFDYLTRDSVECRVKYGHGMEHERFLRSLTTSAQNIGGRPLLRLAIKRKGAASAESFALTRFQMYQSLYWHHTVRAIKAMFFHSIINILIKLKGTLGLYYSQIILESYIKKVLGFSINQAVGKNTLLAKFEAMLRASEPNIFQNHPANRTLSFFWKLADGKDRLLLEDLAVRNLYKRIIEIPISQISENNRTLIRDMFMGDKRIELNRRIENVLLRTLKTSIQDQIATRESLRSDSALEKLEQISNTRNVFLADLPLVGWLAEGDNPIFVCDYKRRHFRADAGGEHGQESISIWQEEILGKMMKQIAVFRVYCEPEMHSLVKRVLQPDSILNALKDEIPQLS